MNAPSVQKTVRTYAAFLDLVSGQFSAATARHAAHCRAGCDRCCSTGLFSISPLDALSLHYRLRRLAAPVRTRLKARSNDLLDRLERERIFFREKPLLRSAQARDQLARRSSGMRCPALDDAGRCIIYEYRPLLCRIFGPTVRGPRRMRLLEGCGCFSRDLPERDFPILSLYKDEDVLLGALSKATGRRGVSSLSTIIPAGLALDIGTFL